MLLRRAGMSHARSQPLKTDRAEHQRSVDIDRRRPHCRSHRHQRQHRPQHQHQCQRRHNAQTHMVTRDGASASLQCAQRCIAIVPRASAYNSVVASSQQPHRAHRRIVTEPCTSTHSRFAALRAAAATRTSTHGGLASISSPAALCSALSERSASAALQRCAAL